MIQPIPVNETFDFILPSDKENPTIWILGYLDSITKTRILIGMFDVKLDSQNIEKSQVIAAKNPLEMDLEACRFGLRGFKNFQSNGNVVSFETEKKEIFGKTYEVVKDETLGKIPRLVLRVLADKILEETVVSEELEKN